MWNCVRALADHWQTLIAGLLGLAGGFVAYFGARGAAKRQVKAANETADREIKAASDAAADQVAAAREQTEHMREMERLRISREGFAFHAMLAAAMAAVIEDVSAARAMPPPNNPSGRAYSTNAYAVRQRVKRTGFPELRAAFLHQGGPSLTKMFLRLDKEIEDFAGQWIPASPTLATGVNAGIEEQLERIEEQARLLQHEAEDRMGRASRALGTDLA